jgi:cellulose synthase/poly-beta-1,6-N-acetylglucosamine synthase-like glycosyltransferase
MRVLFWCSTFLVAYVYVGYPLLIRLWARLRPRPVRLQASEGSLPPVSIVIAARNEGARLAARIENLLSLDYPADKRQIIVVSDGSTDDTLNVLARFADRVETVAIPPSGKALAVNAGVGRATNGVLVFADARQVFDANALTELVAPLADPTVGAVTGELLLDAESPCRRDGRDRRALERRRSARAGGPGNNEASDRRTDDRRRTVRSTIADGVGLYWKYEKQIRKSESAIDSTLGATGAIYAMRRSLFQPLPADTLLDDVLAPMRVVLAGYRVVFNERARAFDRAALDADAEARRKVRTLAGNYQILALEPRLLVPIRNRVWLQYVSHKIARLVVPYALLAVFFASLALATAHPFYFAVLSAYVGMMLLAGCGALIEYRGQIADGRLAALRPIPSPARRMA